MTTEVNSFSFPSTRHDFPPPILNGVLENILVCAQFSLKLKHGTLMLCFITQLFRQIGIL